MNIKKSVSILVAIMLISGCAFGVAPQKTKTVTTHKKNTASPVATNNKAPKQNYNDIMLGQLKYCERNLFILKETKSNQYSNISKKYKKTALQVNTYLSIRDTLPIENRSPLDSIYLKSVKTICDTMSMAAEQSILKQIPKI